MFVALCNLFRSYRYYDIRMLPVIRTTGIYFTSYKKYPYTSSKAKQQLTSEPIQLQQSNHDAASAL